MLKGGGCLLLSRGSAKRYSSEQTELQSASSQLLSNTPDSLFNYRETAREMREYGPADSITALLGRNLNKVLKCKS